MEKVWSVRQNFPNVAHSLKEPDYNYFARQGFSEMGVLGET
jgi:hypothetical protein